MKIWKTGVIDLRCGGCGTEIQKATPYLEIRVAGMGRHLKRCANCADEEPHDVDTYQEPTRPSFLKSVAGFTQVTQIGRDYKELAAGDKVAGGRSGGPK
jgi:hypothetical protein